MGQLLITGPDKKLAIIKRRFISFGVTFQEVSDKPVVAMPPVSDPPPPPAPSKTSDDDDEGFTGEKPKNVSKEKPSTKGKGSKK